MQICMSTDISLYWIVILDGEVCVVLYTYLTLNGCAIYIIVCYIDNAILAQRS